MKGSQGWSDGQSVEIWTTSTAGWSPSCAATAACPTSSWRACSGCRRRRFARLQAEHGLQVTARVTPPAQQSRMVYLIHTQPGRRFEVAEFLAVQSGIDTVHLTTGSADVLAAASFADDAEALRFLVQVVEAHPGVRTADPSHLTAPAGGAPPAGLDSPRIDTDALAAATIGPQRHRGIGELIDAVCDAAITGLGADRVLVATADGEHGYTLAGMRGISSGYLDALNRLIDEGMTDGVIRRVWQTRLHVYVADARTDPLMAAAHRLVRAEGYVSILTLPLLYGTSLVASVSLYYDTARVLDDAYIAAAQSVADSLAVAFARLLGQAPPGPAGHPDEPDRPRLDDRHRVR